MNDDELRDGISRVLLTEVIAAKEFGEYTSLTPALERIMQLIDREWREGGWVKCSERMPEKDGEYAIVDHRGVSTGYFRQKDAFGCRTSDISHWHELPQLPPPPSDEAKE